MREQDLTRMPRFAATDVDTFGRVLKAKEKFEYGQHEMYFRDGFPALYELESHVATLVGADKGHVLLTNTGMSALYTAIEVASPTKGDSVVHNFQGYSQTEWLVTEKLADRGVNHIAVDTGSLSDIEEALKKYRPKVVLFETVVNGPVMSVLDVEGFLNLPVLQEVNPLVILDNTFPTGSNLPLAEILQGTDLKVVGVESATKSYALNQELGGILFTYDEYCFRSLRINRRGIGSILGPSAVDTIRAVVPSTKELFDREHLLATWNTFMLARACAEVGSDRFSVSYPNLLNHPNSAFASEHYPYGAAPAFFIQPIADLSVITLAKALESDGVLNDCRLAQSFCFDKTGISFDSKGTFLRIAGGLEDPQQLSHLQQGFRQTLLTFQGGK